jgi:DNA repair protein RecO (recombination protein O)
MPVLLLESIVLQTFPYSETSKILRLLTRTHGVRSALARGAMRPKSKYGVLEPFAEGLATFYLREGRELQTLSGFELTRSHQALGRNLVRFGGASLLAELVLRTASEESQPALFDALSAGLAHLEAASDEQVEAVALAECWNLVAHLGFAPSLDECLACGRAIAEDEDVRLDHAAGAVLCAECAPGGASSPGRPLPAFARATLGRFLRGEAAPAPERTAAHWALLRRFLLHHVVEGSELRSLEFLESALKERSGDDA